MAGSNSGGFLLGGLASTGSPLTNNTSLFGVRTTASQPQNSPVSIPATKPSQTPETPTSDPSVKRPRLDSDSMAKSAAPKHDFADEIVEVSVGGRLIPTGLNNPPTIYRIHQNVLRKTSKFFQAATKPEWKGSTPRHIDLNDEDPRDFAIYTRWLYYQRIEFDLPWAVLKPWEALARSYTLGERLMDIQFQNMVLTKMMRLANESLILPTVKAIKTLFDGTPTLSPARKLLVDIYAYCGRSGILSSTATEHTHVDFMDSLVQLLFQSRQAPDKASRPWLVAPELYRVQPSREVKSEKD